MTTDDSRERRWAAAYAERTRLLRIARRRTASEAEAEDCVSEAMLRAVEFDGLDEDRIAAFLTTVTLRLCADGHRGRARLARLGGQLVGEVEEPGPEDTVCDRAEAQWLVESLRGMSAHQRRVVAARAEGLSCDDVARRLGVSVDAVKSAVARVRGTARAALAKTLGMSPAARWPGALGRRTGADLVAGGALATVLGVTLSGMLAVPPAPRPPAYLDAVPPVAREQVAPVRVTPSPASTRVTMRVTRRAVAAVSAAVRDVTAETVPEEYGWEPIEQEVGSTTIVANDNPHYSLEEQIIYCLTHGPSTQGTIGCPPPEEPTP